MKINYPATYPEDWVFKVGGVNAEFEIADNSTYGNLLDIVAPSTGDLYTSLNHDNNSGYTYSANGTSYAAPHVAGVAALLHSEHHVNNSDHNYPNNLAPEDYEQIIQRFPTDIPPTGYDSQTGSGIVNAEESLEGLSLPQFHIRHAGGQTDLVDIDLNVAFGQGIILAENINGIASGTYEANRYQITYNFNTILEPNQTLIDSWQRLSSSVGFSGANPQNGDTWFSYSVSTNQNVVSVSATTFAYFITSSFWGQQINQWIPAHPDQLKTAYSLYVEDNSITSVDEVEATYGAKLYPNPSSNKFTMSFELASSADVLLELMDVTGRLVVKHNMPNQAKGHQSVIIDIENLTKGLYLCNLFIGEERISKRVIKH